MRAGWDTKMPLGKRFPNLPLEKQCQGRRRAPSLNHEYCILEACIYIDGKLPRISILLVELFYLADVRLILKYFFSK